MLVFAAFDRQLWTVVRPKQIANGHLGRVGRSFVHVQQVICRTSGIQQNLAEQINQDQSRHYWCAKTRIFRVSVSNVNQTI